MNTNLKSPINGSTVQSGSSQSKSVPVIKTKHPTLWINNDGFITDGDYTCLVTKGRYSIGIFKNPSGELTPRLSGYRPKEVLLETAKAVDDGESKDQRKSKPARVRENKFDTLKEADAKRDELMLEDDNSEDHTRLLRTSLTPAELRDAEAAKAIMQKIPPFDRNLTPWTYTRTAEFAAKNFKPCENEKDFSEATEAYIAMKDTDANRSSATLAGLRRVLGNLAAACPGKKVHQVPAETIMPFIYRGETLATIKRYRTDYMGFFDWCMSPPRKWAAENPVLHIQLPDREDEQHIPEILPNAAVELLLTKALTFKGGRLFLFCVCAIGCALRPAEIGRIQALLKVLGKASFHFGEKPSENYINVIGKQRKRRMVIIPPEFVPLVRVFVEAGYPILPRNFTQDWTHLRALAGYCGVRGLLPTGFDADKLIPWVEDVCRHTGGTHHLFRYENEYKTALWMGNSTKMIFTHYRGLSTEMQSKEFFEIASKLRIPTLEELKQLGIPEGATDALLAKFSCKVDRHTTFAMKKSTFQAERATFLVKHPEAALPERKGFTRGKGMWTKRRMLDLPPREKLAKLYWTKPIDEIAEQFKVARSTMALVAEDHDIPLPEKGHWQQRAAGKPVVVPDEIAKLFPEGLPKYTAAVGRKLKLEIPPLAEFFNRLWSQSLTEIAAQLHCDLKCLDSLIKHLRVPKPGHSFWRAKPKNRIIPDRIKRLLTLTSEQLRVELDKETLVDVNQPAEPFVTS